MAASLASASAFASCRGCNRSRWVEGRSIRQRVRVRIGTWNLWTSSRKLSSRMSVLCKADGLRIGEQIETDKLPTPLRNSVMKSIDRLGRRVTVGDVATTGGLKLSEAQTALQALATDAGGFLEVSDEGDILYVFPDDFRVKLVARSFRLKLEPAISKLKAAFNYLVRVSFGTTLLASLVIVYSSIYILLSSARSQDDDRGNRGYSRSPGISFYISPYDLFWYWDPYYYRRRKARRSDMNFLESVFSFVFGDGDPNADREEIRWQEIGNHIAAKGGVVTAEELAPFLDVPPLRKALEEDESFILPVLLRFDGKPEVDAEGNIVYRFPSLQRTGTNRFNRTQRNALEYFEELLLPFSQAKNQVLVIALGAFNLLGVLTLGTLMKDFAITGQSPALLQFVSSVFPLLQAYTVAFFAIPLFRWLQLQQKNDEIQARNMARKERAVLVQQPDSNLRKKLMSARKMAERTFIGKERIIYTTEKDISEQDYDTVEWERRLEERTGSS